MTADVASHRAPIFEAIDRERDRQIALGYTPEHDREHGGVNHLTGWIMTYAAQADNAAYNSKFGPGREQYLERLRPALIRAAALCVAAVESFDTEVSA